MARFLIEVNHENNQAACDRTVAIFKATGSHFLVNADWGCKDNVHKAWFIIELDSKEEALIVVPPQLRQNATATALDKLSLEGMEETVKQHQE
ncbi:MAG: hypothetical protein UX85_C0004G0198 [Candidatus Beckwithbacteria bacterium GW2011_GWB1_47_15]|uniref:Uncharacterized protein n=1 Tax=Candidatus Beckwithbacteria bacterium GW2011_GWB1_47_15 TaxID=1618371 RepID=A0A0G1RVY6_9BACT|nr:MAG: hypothetical protein UY43_C0001G0037 [Candidatus Beckwithbacteria bacterium GW2011_GWC1_49_16]KKU61276.1 MAG: hypothetical protein UX85_C0004G0198 [Candidatus Beckwithbacteria bacterium GW2011_GWB1_47_15]OGD48427.1 MAG: hypothetical protein A2877_03220 [Candidatus Beckwithbacteria bacterium RIFCSPHIGHO2_01_FULL_49_39]OGD50549.1 MAG: hypothetical protein A3D86_00365 [Candidatus Beckwithbacteria bacterium RIFCSPHIGHO2_02_FULL_49_13]OGD51556.1 MAG: hypothetical protein A3K56_03655 [Candida